MTRKWMGTLVIAVALAMARTAASQTATFDETWVEYTASTCGTNQKAIKPNTTGFASNELDDDTRTGTSEDSETGTLEDSIFSSISVAEGKTNASGVVQVFARGVYRETDITLDASITIHGASDADVILSDDCSSSTSKAFIVNISAGETVILENLTIREYTYGIDASGSDGGTLILRNCNIQDCTTAAILSDESLAIQLIGCRLTGNATGITACQYLQLQDSEVSGSTTAGITAVNALPWIITNSVIANNATGLTTTNAGLGTGAVQIADSRIVGNGSHGVLLENAVVRFVAHRCTVTGNDGDGIRLRGNNGSTFNITDSLVDDNTGDGVNIDNTSSACLVPSGDGFEGTVSDSRIVGNADDGIEIDVGTNTTCSPPTNYPSWVFVGLMRNLIASNGDYAIAETTNNSAMYRCQVGENVLDDNTTGTELNTGATTCTVGTTSANQVN